MANDNQDNQDSQDREERTPLLATASERARALASRTGDTLDRLSESLSPRARNAVVIVKENPWWVASIVVSVIVGIFLIVTLLQPGGLMGPGAEVRTEVELRLEDLVTYPSDDMREDVLGRGTVNLWEEAGLDYRAFYSNVLSSVKTEIKKVDASPTGSTAKVVLQVTHPNMDEVQQQWIEKVQAYPVTEEDKAYIRNASYAERRAVVLRMLDECFANKNVPTRTDLITLTVNHGNTGWHIANSSWAREVALSGVDLSMMLGQTVVVEQPQPEDEAE